MAELAKSDWAQRLLTSDLKKPSLITGLFIVRYNWCVIYLEKFEFEDFCPDTHSQKHLSSMVFQAEGFLEISDAEFLKKSHEEIEVLLSFWLKLKQNSAYFKGFTWAVYENGKTVFEKKAKVRYK